MIFVSPDSNPGADASAPDSAASGPGDPWWHRAADPEPDAADGSTAAMLGVAIDEVLQLVEGVHGWARTAGVGAAARETVGQVAATLSAAHQPDPAWCQVCPVCRVASALSTARPDLSDKVAEVLALATALTQVALDALAGQQGSGEAESD